MSSIDDFFRNNLTNKGLEYEDLYWDSMEVMLDAKKRRKPFFGYRKIILPLAFAFFCLAGFFMFRTLTQGNRETLNEANKKAEASMKQVEPVGNKGGGDVLITSETSVLAAENKTNANQKSATSPIRKANQTQHEKAVMVSNSITQIDESKTVEKVLPEEEIIQGTPKAFAFVIPVRSAAKPGGNTRLQSPGSFETIVTRGKFRPQQLWALYLSAGYEFDMYSKALNLSPLKADERTVNRAGYNMNVSVRKNNWGFKSGLGLLQLAELTNYVTVNKHYSLTTNYKVIDPNYGQSPGGTKIVLIKPRVDTVVTSNTSIQNPNGLAQFTYVKIPLLATYEIILQRFRIYAETGLNTAILAQRKGEFTSFENNRYVVRNSAESNDFNTLLFQAHSAGGLKYSIHNSLNVYAGYGYSWSLNSMMKSYMQRPKISLITFGLEVKM
jgi:hypothetical protein